VVIVPGLEKKPPVSREKLLTWNEINSADTDAASIVLAPIVSRGEGSKELNDWLKGIDKARNAAERKRLFYVACTRAREELHLFASPEETSKGEVHRPYGSLLATAWPAAQMHFADVVPVAEDRTKKFVMSLFPEEEDEGFIDSIAASGEEQERPTMLQRLPLNFSAHARFDAARKLPYGDVETAMDDARFDRPVGSFEARAFGNALHAFLEILAKRLADRIGVEMLLREIVGWSPRIAAVLRGEGLSPAVVERLTTRVETAMTNTLRDPEGLWVLSSHNWASSEHALTSWEDKRGSVRLDRVFLAGAEPLKPGDDYLWIIDYKTATHGRERVDDFLAEERAKYGPQMEAYGRMMHGRETPGKLRVGLYYPTLSRLIWWQP